MRWMAYMCDDIKENTFEDNEERHKNLVQFYRNWFSFMMINGYLLQQSANMTGVQDTKDF